MFCASKNEGIDTNENELTELQEQIDDLEYIIKNTATGDDFANSEQSAPDVTPNTSDKATSIQVLKAKINY